MFARYTCQSLTSKSSFSSVLVPSRLCSVSRARCIVAASHAEAPPASNTVLTDAKRRELETLARRQAYEAEKAQELAAEGTGLSWWEVDCPENMVNVLSLEQLKVAVEAESCSSTGRLVVVNFFAPECYACKSMQPKLRQIARNNPDVLFLKVNGLTGDLKQYCEDMGITRIPFFHFYRANKRVAAFAANMRPEKLALLRAEIAAHKPQSLKAADTPQYTALEV